MAAENVSTVLIAALGRQAAGSKSRDVAALADVVKELLHAQVCPRCVLRILRHNIWEDYYAELPDQTQLLQCLEQKMGSHKPDASDHKATEAQAAEKGGDAEPAAQAGQDAAGCTAGSCGGNTDQPGPRPLVPCTLCLGILQRLCSASLAGTETAVEAPAAPQEASGPYSNRAVPSLNGAALSEVLTSAGAAFTTFALEVNLPASVTLRERIVAEHLAARFAWLGIYKGNADQFVPLKTVLRKVLGPLILEELGHGRKLLDGGADLTLVLTLAHAEALAELRPLLEDHVAFQHKKRTAANQPHLSNRQRKKQRRDDRMTAAAAAQAPAAGQEPQGETLADQSQEAGEAGKAGEGEGSAQPSTSQAADLNAEVDAMLQSISPDKAASQVQGVPSRIFRRLFPWPLKPLASDHMQQCPVNVRLTRASVFLAGRYLKLQRGMPQSKWFDQQTGERIGCVSLAERLEEAVLPLYKADETKFISGGREDADVRMLGEGRPFVLELINPQHVSPSKEELACVERALAEAEHGARAIQLTPCSKKAIDKIKEAEESKEKTYSMLCWAERPLTEEDVARLLAAKDLTVMQDTPLRVLHRRAPKIRSKQVSVEGVEVLPDKPNYFKLQLRTQAGAYVKEFCHGDLGRTTPNLGTLLSCRTEILQLDVVAVHMPDWP